MFLTSNLFTCPQEGREKKKKTVADLSAFNEGGGGGSPGLCGLRRSAGGSLLLTQFPRSLASRVQFPRPLSDESVCFSFYSRSCGFT